MLDGPGYLDDLWNPAVGGMLTATEMHLQRAVLVGLCSEGSVAIGTRHATRKRLMLSAVLQTFFNHFLYHSTFYRPILNAFLLF